MIKAMYRRKSLLEAYSFRELVHDCYDGEHGRQARPGAGAASESLHIETRTPRKARGRSCCPHQVGYPAADFSVKKQKK